VNKFQKTLALVLIQASLASPADANEKQDLLQLRNTVVNLVDALVAQGVLNKDQAAALIKKAEDDAAQQAAEQVAADDLAPPVAPDPNVVRVPYVPEFVKQEIREQVRSELRQDVLADVSQKAKQEKWGTPDALPGWISTVKLYGDVRIRHQLDRFGSDNPDTLSADNLYLDILKINDAGGISAAGTDAFLNTSLDANRWRERVRLGLTAKIADRWTFDTRLATGNQLNPISTNLTLGNTGQRFSIQLDRASLQYERPSDVGPPWLTLTLGRMANPWISTDLLWDEDLNFDGAALALRHPLSFFDDGLVDIGDRARTLSATVGLFPLDQLEFSTEDKWLAGGQLAAVWEFDNQNKIQLATAFYDYIHTIGKRNALGSTITNSTQPEFLQKGNLLFNIANDPNLDGGINDQIFALASDYRLFDVNASLDLAYRSRRNHTPHRGRDVPVSDQGTDFGLASRNDGGLAADHQVGRLAGQCRVPLSPARCGAGRVHRI
jgi:Putative porin